LGDIISAAVTAVNFKHGSGVAVVMIVLRWFGQAKISFANGMPAWSALLRPCFA
jgi:hypothetical protein